MIKAVCGRFYMKRSRRTYVIELADWPFRWLLRPYKNRAGMKTGLKSSRTSMGFS